MTAPAIAALGSADTPFDRELATWQGRVANAAANCGGLDAYRDALTWAKQNVPLDNGLREKAKQEIRETAERHLAEAHGANVLDAIYFAVFLGEATNADLDADVRNSDQSAETNAEIKRLAKLSVIEYERQRKPAAEKLGIDRITALDKLVEQARVENGDTKG